MSYDGSYTTTYSLVYLIEDKRWDLIGLSEYIF